MLNQTYYEAAWIASISHVTASYAAGFTFMLWMYVALLVWLFFRQDVKEGAS